MNSKFVCFLSVLLIVGCGKKDGSSSVDSQQREEHPEDSYRSLIEPLNSGIVGTASAERTGQGMLLRIKIVNAPSKPLFHLIFSGQSCPERSQVTAAMEIRSKGNMDRKILVEDFSLKNHVIGIYGESDAPLACGLIIQIPYEG